MKVSAKFRNILHGIRCLKDYLEVVVVAVEGLGHVGGDVGVAAGEQHVDHVRGEGRHLHTRVARV